jgi:hypothetical protein
MTKFIVRKTIAKKEILVPSCERSSWWNNSYELILVVIMRRIRFLLVIISFHAIAFIFYGAFENISITFRFFFIFLLCWLCDLSVCIFLEGILFFMISKACLDEW